MKNKYTLKTLILSLFVVLVSFQAYAQIRVVRVDPATNEVTIRNYGSPNNPEDISGYWLCNFPDYDELGDMTVLDGSLNLAVGAEVTLTSGVNFPVADAEVALYNDNDFGSSTAIIDYLQWGSAAHQRESVAVAAGLWTAGTFIQVAPPFSYNGDGSQNGVGFWETSLSVEGFEANTIVRLFPNPAKNTLNVELVDNASNASITMFNMLGKLVLSKSIQPTESIDITNLVSGVYLVKINSNQGSQTLRIVKQ